jgi:hypothetical protein
MSTITATQQTAIADYLDGRHLGSGIGTVEKPCSVAAINLALTGQLTDDIPDCMSPVIGRWIIRIQDAMPDALRNSDRWRSLLPLAAGTGRNHEAARAAEAAAWAAAEAAGAAAEAARAAAGEAEEAAADYWIAIDPCAMLERLINIGAES